MELEVKLAEVEQWGKSNTRRIENLEKSSEALSRLATAVEVMATKQDGLGKKVDALGTKVDTLEQVPGRRWSALVDKLLLVLAGAFVAWIAGGAVGL